MSSLGFTQLNGGSCIFKNSFMEDWDRDWFRIKGRVERVIFGAWYVWMFKDIQETCWVYQRKKKASSSYTK